MSGFAQGQRVRLTQDCQALHTGPEIFKKGETGTLGEMYRIQDGLEIWHLDMDQKRYDAYTFIAVAHTQIERIDD